MAEMAVQQKGIVLLLINTNSSTINLLWFLTVKPGLGDL